MSIDLIARGLLKRIGAACGRLHRDESAQAMTEAALTLPLVVMVFMGAHEFMYQNEWKFLTGRASRLVVWQMADHFNTPLRGFYDNDPIPNSDVKKTTADPQWTTYSTQANDLFFSGRFAAAGFAMTKTETTDEYAFRKSFDFDTDFSDGGGSPSDLEDDMSSGDPGTAGGLASMFSSIAGAVTSVAGEAMTGVSLTSVIRFGPELPTRGWVQGGFTMGWDATFFSILVPVSGSSGGTTRHAYFGAEGGNARFESEMTGTVGSAATVVPIGMFPIDQPSTEANRKRVYARFGILAHDYRPIDNDDQGSIHWHIKGWTLLGALSPSSNTGGGDGGGLAGDIIGFLADNFFPWKCCLRNERIAAESEDGDHLGEDFPNF